MLALSKMDWNTDALYGGVPATITYAQVLARVVKHDNLPSTHSTTGSSCSHAEQRTQPSSRRR